MKALLDIGDEKTGSKSRQGFMRINAQFLANNGFLSLKSTKVGGYDLGLAAYAGRRKFIRMYREQNAIPCSVDLDEFIENGIAKEIKESDSHTAVFSFEGLMKLNSREIRKLVSMLKRYFSEVSVLGFIKRQDKWAVSAYTTRLTNLGATDTNAFYLFRILPHGRNYFKAYRLWEKFISKNNLTFLDYDGCKDVVRTFSDFVGVPEGAVFEEVRRNPSMSELGVEILRRFNKDLAHSKKYKDRKFCVIQSVREYYIGSPYLPSRSDAYNFFLRFSGSNKKLAKILGGEQRYFFDEDFSRYPEDVARVDLTLSEVEGYIAKAIKKREEKKKNR